MLDIRKPGTGRRQADPNQRLAAENRRLRDRLDEQQRQHEDKVAEVQRDLESITCHFTELSIQFKTAQMQRDAANTKASRVDAAEHRAAEAERQRDEEHAELTALRARVANLDPWRIPQVGARDIDPDGQATHPIDVRALRAEHAEPWRSPVVHLSQAPFAAPTPADADPRSLSHRFMAGETRVTVTGGPFAKATA